MFHLLQVLGKTKTEIPVYMFDKIEKLSKLMIA